MRKTAIHKLREVSREFPEQWQKFSGKSSVAKIIPSILYLNTTLLHRPRYFAASSQVRILLHCRLNGSGVLHFASTCKHMQAYANTNTQTHTHTHTHTPTHTHAHTHTHTHTHTHIHTRTHTYTHTHTHTHTHVHVALLATHRLRPAQLAIPWSKWAQPGFKGTAIPWKTRTL